MVTSSRAPGAPKLVGQPRTVATCAQRRPTLLGRGGSVSRRVLIVLLVLMAAVSACRSIRPTTKVGLLAPFEGLYRAQGYTALQAMRLALTDAPIASIDRLPLALDLSLDAQRAMQKLLADGAVHAVIGPLTPQSASAVQMLHSATAWYLPFAISSTGEFVAVTDFDAWAKPLFLTVADAMQRQDRARLVVVGWPARWPTEMFAQWSAVADLPFIVSNDPAVVAADDAVFHFGEPAEAAAYLRRLRLTHADLPFVLGSAGQDPVFVEHNPNTHAVYWVTWTDAGYGAWAALHPPTTHLAYLVYRATQAALNDSKVAPPTNGTTWSVHFMALENDSS